MPGTIRSMYLEHMLRDVQTDRGSLLHGRLLRWQFRHRHLGTKMPSGGVHPITPSPTAAVLEPIADRPQSTSSGPSAFRRGNRSSCPEAVFYALRHPGGDKSLNMCELLHTFGCLRPLKFTLRGDLPVFGAAVV